MPPQYPPHHEAWLAAHPDRSREWLRRMIAEGFDVHHVDEDHSNNHPANLVLIEMVDHLRLHGLFRLLRPDGRAVSSRGGKNRWAGKTQKEKSAHMKMMVMARIKKDRKRRAALRSLDATAAQPAPVESAPL